MKDKDKTGEHKRTTAELLKEFEKRMTPEQKEFSKNLSLKAVSKMQVESVRSDSGRVPSHYTNFYQVGYFREERNMRSFLKSHHPHLLAWAEGFMEKVFDVLPRDLARLDLAVENYMNDYGPEGNVREPEKFLCLEMVKQRLKLHYDYVGDVCLESRVLNLMDKVHKQQQLKEEGE